MKRLLLLAVVLGLIGLGIGYALAFAPNARGAEEGRGVKVPEGATFETVLDSLESAGLIRSRTTLRWFGRLTGWGEQVKPGHYLVADGMSNWALLDKIRKGLQDPIRITVPPGRTPAQFAAALRRQLGTDSAAVRVALRDTSFADSLGTDLIHLFGHMRANTYDVFWTTNAKRAIERIHNWHERYWTQDKRAAARALGLTPDEVITLASIVEWEARVPEERPRIAGVYLNRLLGRTPAVRMRLQADPTVQFALMQADGGPMRRLLLRDYQFPSPYNTYLVDGLPPGPITNPSDASIEAVLNAERHDFLYFVANGTGGHTFARTGAEHAANARRWSAWITRQYQIRDSLRADSVRRGLRPAN
ncbi:MAG TPA: endolytic transglycosylase MltG [Rubricoccaceae bacterium]|nr:endolytic transglycosylase MltG [Rubricoccaceae bacterium]